MDLKQLQQHIRTLIQLEQNASPLISCYLNLEAGIASSRQTLQTRAGSLRKNLRWHERQAFEEAVAAIESCMSFPAAADVKGMAIFARGGAEPFLMSLRFCVPLPTWIVMGSSPNIYHLVELKETYHRFVTVICTERNIRIFEVNLGKVTEALGTLEQVRKKSSKLHYQSHRSSTEVWLQEAWTVVWIAEAVQVLEALMSKGGYKHLILAGDEPTCARLGQALPPRLACVVVGRVACSDDDAVSDILAAAISSFLEHEERESLATVEQLQRKLNAGLAVSGTHDTLKTLQSGAVDVLVMARDYEPGPAWMCAHCESISLEPSQLDACSVDAGVQYVDLKEAMMRMAESGECTIEIVNRGNALSQLGGVGAILRYRHAESARRARSAIA